MKIFKRTLFIMFCFSLMNFSTVFAAGIDHFEVKFSPSEAKVGESIDLTIEAVDKNNEVVEDYDGIVVIFSETDPEVELPNSLEDNTYSFIASDQGVIKFENAVIFQTKGNQELSVYDLDDDTVLGIGEVTINQEEQIIVEDTSIEILSPENGLIIGEDKITISGSSQKNHTIKILINDTEEIMTITNSDGTFEKEITNLSSGENIFKAQILDSDSNVIGESEEVIINIDSNTPKLKDIEMIPEEVDAESIYEIRVIASEGLTEVSVIIDDTLTTLDEDEREEGVYKKSIYSPAKEGNYKIDVTLKDELGHEINELGAGNLIVKKVELDSAEPIKEEPVIVKEEPVKPVKPIKEEPEAVDFKVTGLKLIELKSKSVLSWNDMKGVEGYNVYKKLEGGELELIQEVKEPKFEVAFSGSELKYEYFAVKPIGKTASGELYEGDLSEATKIKTGPEILLLLILSLFIGGMVFVTKRKKA